MGNRQSILFGLTGTEEWRLRFGGCAPLIHPTRLRVMRNGEPTSGLEFYALLYEDDDFCRELGRAVLSAGRLESALKLYLEGNAPDEKVDKATLGRLVRIANKNSLLKRMLPHLEVIRDQRNYLTHNVHALFAGLVEETILERSGLLDSDVDVFTERARQLRVNVDHLADIVFREIGD